MSTARNLIEKAYRELNVTAIGVSPTTAQLQEGLDRMNGVLRIIFGAKMGELLQDWNVPSAQRTAPVAANYPQGPLGNDASLMGNPTVSSLGASVYPYPPRNSRIIFAGKSSTTVYFPEAPDDGSRMGLIQGITGPAAVNLLLDGNGRSIGGAATVSLTTPLTAMRWIYRADLGDWRPIASLGLDDEMPFPEDMDDYFITYLAIRIAPANDKTVSPETAKAFKDAETIFEARYKQTGVTTFGSGDVPTGYQSFQGGRYWW